MIDKATVQRIKDTADIVDIVGDYVNLIRRGANYMGLCPFHNERTPSFSVNPGRNFCYCFSCHKGGSPVNFIMEKEGLSYHDALMHLAHRYGIKVEERELSDQERQAQTERESMLVANEWAMQKMEHDLWETDEGRDVGLQYFYSRGLTDEAIRKFRLGYALDKPGALTGEARRSGYDIEVLKNLGLVGVSREGREYDRFRGRVIYPIINSANKVIAFGGRDLKGGLAKYINSPESSLYKKSNELYGIAQARSAIVNENRCFLVEGYMDVIGMWQSGLKNVVASSGTALTDGQINLIHRFTPNVTLIYDGDNAGIKAALRGIDMLLAHDMDVKVLLLPDGHDPDSFARVNTPQQFRDYVEKHSTDIIRFKTEILMKDVEGDPQKRVDAIRSVIQSLANINDRIKLDVYVSECSEILGISANTVMDAVAKARKAIIDKKRKAEYIANRNEPGSATQEDPTVSEAASNKTENRPILRPINANPFYPLEKTVIEYCLKYGYVNFYIEKDEQGQEWPVNVLDFITNELSVDNLEFSDPTFARIFELLHEGKDDFRVSLDSRILDIESEMEQKKREMLDLIMENGIAMSEIATEERRIEKELSQYKEEQVLKFTKDFPGKELASHEDDKIRTVAFNLINEKHHLSNIYTKDNRDQENLSQKLVRLLPRAISEWKAEIMNQKMQQLLDNFKKIAGRGNLEEELKIQRELARVMDLRSQIAKCVGERILYISGKSSK